MIFMLLYRMLLVIILILVEELRASVENEAGLIKEWQNNRHGLHSISIAVIYLLKSK